MKTLRKVTLRDRFSLVACCNEESLTMFLVLRSAQASKWASFYSSFWACFRKIRLFSGWLNVLFLMHKISTLAASAMSLRIVAVRSLCEVLPWKRC